MGYMESLINKIKYGKFRNYKISFLLSISHILIAFSYSFHIRFKLIRRFHVSYVNSSNYYSFIPLVISGLALKMEWKLTVIFTTIIQWILIRSNNVFLNEKEIDLRLRSMKIKKYPNFSGYENVKLLSLYDNEIKEFPTRIKKIESLVYISFKKNKITNFSGKTKGFETVETLNLEENKISNIFGKSKFEGLESLTYLYLSWNKITKISEKIEGLDSL